MMGATMLVTLQRLGVAPSFSRPKVSDDDLFSKALFKTLKHYPSYPDPGFASIDEARSWVERFVHWYNNIRIIVDTTEEIQLLNTMIKANLAFFVF